MIQIHIEARNAQEAREQMQQLLALSSASLTVTPTGGIEARATAPAAAPVQEKVAAPNAATPDPTANPPWEEPSVSTSTPTETANQTEAPTASAEEVRAALNGLRKAKGTAALRATFDRYGVKSFPELNPSVYGALLREVREALNDGQ